MIVEIKKLFEDANIPAYATVGSAGFDLEVYDIREYYKGDNNKAVLVPSSQDYSSLFPGDRMLIGCGYSIAIPKGYMMDVRSRSGKSLKEGLVVANSPGTIDSDYRGEVGVILINKSRNNILITKGDKVAQGLILQYNVALFIEVDKLSETERGSGGFGHTDNKLEEAIP